MHILNPTPGFEQGSITKERLVIIDDDEPFSKECLVQAISSAFPNLTVTGVSGGETLYHLDKAPIALILLKIHQAHPLSGRRLPDAIGATLQEYPDTPLVVLSACTNAATVGEIIASGVRGVIPVTTSFKIAVAALQLIMVGGIYSPFLPIGDLQTADGANKVRQIVSQEAEPYILSHATAKPSPNLVKQPDDMVDANPNVSNGIFTTRELEVLGALQNGWSNKWIAHSLHISENTIKVHIQRIMRKLHVSNRTEAVIRHRQLSSSR